MVAGDTQVTRALPSLEHLHRDGLLQDSCPISTEALLAMSKGELNRYLTFGPGEDSSYIHNVQALWRSLLATMREPSVIDAHMTAVCNAISVFLGSASSSPLFSVQMFAMSAETWTAIFDALLHRFEVGKLKPLRQVLTTLIKILSHHSDSSRARSTEDYILSRMGGIILLGKPAMYLKASMVIFEAFMRSNIPVTRILTAIGRCHGANREQWDHRLSKERIDPTGCYQTMSLHGVDESISCFSQSVILTVAHSDTQVAAGTFFIRLISMLLDCNISLDSVWVEQIASTLRRHPKSIEAFKNYLLPSLLKLHPDQCHSLLHKMISRDGDPLMLQTALSIAIVARDGGFVSEKEIMTSLGIVLGKGSESGQSQDDNDSEATAFFKTLLTHSSAGVRIRTYELLASSQETTKPIRSTILSLLSKHLAYLSGDPDPGRRGEISGITVNMVNRLRQGSTFHSRALSRPDQKTSQYEEHKYELEQHEEFLDCFIDFIEDELGPNCSFPRHISALKALQSLVESRLDPSIPVKNRRKLGKDLAQWPFQKSLTYRNLRRILWRLMLDPFEEIRATVTPILQLILQSGRYTLELSQGDVSRDQEGVSSNQNMPWVNSEHLSTFTKDSSTSSRPKEEIAQILEDANKLAALTNRADHADGVGRLIWLQHMFSSRPSLIPSPVLERVEMSLGGDNADKSAPAMSVPLHACLIGLMYIVEYCGLQETSDQGMVLKDTSITVDRLLRMCNEVWQTVREDLCIDSPEMSHNPDTMGPSEGPKDFLSYSWRALRDSSLLVQALLLHLGSGPDEAVANTGRVRHLRTIYALCFEQLTALRHRGAFSTVAQTFAICCEKSASAPSLRSGFKAWFEDALRILEDQSSKLTRRSAGLPAIIAGLLIPSTLEEFNAVLETLSSLAKSKQDFSDIKNGQETRLPQVHALNCLREILTDSRFRSRSIAWLTKLLDLAAASLSSTVWAIRNCGLMLFRACASRIGNNADKSELETNEVDSSDQWAAILDIALKLLDSVQVNNTNSSELVFAGLDLLSRISISASDRAPTRQRILTHLGSPIWMIREHAARVYASQILDKEALETAVGLIASMEMTDQNRCHGSLLCSRKLIEKYFHRSVPFSDAKSPGIEHILQLQAPFVEQFASPAVQSAFLDIMNECIAVQRKSPMGHRALNSKEREENWQFQSLHNRTRRANSATPFVAQLSFSKALHACLVTLTEGDDTAQVLHQIFWDVAAHDTDTASALLQALTAQVSSDQHALTLFVDLYISIIQDDHSEDITAAAMYGLSSSLQAELDGDGSPLAKQTSRRLVDSLASSRDNESRDLFNARITALGNVLTLRSRETQSVWSEPSSKALNIWIKMVGHAAGDAIEAPTRLNAAKALHAFRRCFLEQCDSVAVYNKFKLCLILYDLLNDDDEEIRDLAASTTSFIVTTAGSGITVQLCPLAACHQFSDYLAENFTNKDEFHFAALSRLMFSPLNEFEDMDSHVDSFKALTSQYSVGRQLDLARQVSYDLFEEERQNLYLDDVREINFWWSIIRRISRIWIQDDILFFVGNWALEGLRELIAALPTLNDGPFGVSSKLEVIALILRVISVADLSLIWEDNSDSGSFPPRKSANLEEMEGLLFLGRKYGIHPQAQKALEDSVRRGQLNLEARGLYYRMSLEEANK